MNPRLAQFFLRPPAGPSPPPPPSTAGLTAPPWIAIYGPRAPRQPLRTVPPWMVLFALPRYLPAPSLLAAIESWWNGPGGLSTSIGPLFTRLAPASTVPPFVSVAAPNEGGHGLTLDDKAVELWFSVFANSLAVARGYGSAIKDTINPAMSGRGPWTWSRGSERGTYPEDRDEKEKMKAKDKNSNDVWCYHVPFTVYIAGDP